jgi:tetratricopeptide (TPR) repeat protein
MSDAAPIPEPQPEPLEGPPDPPQPGLLADPVVRLMVFAALGLVVLFLAAAIGVLTTGVTAPTGARSAAERELMIAAMTAQNANGAALAPYINALIAAGNLPAARISLGQARASASATAPVAALDLAEARLLSADAQYENGASMADKAMKNYIKEYEARLAKPGADAAKIKSAGYGADYYNAALVRGFALARLRQWKDAVAMFDLYLAKVPTASDILIDRGNAKAGMNDKAGAEKDFRAALKFVPYDEEAKAGLKKIGVAQ